MRAIQGLQRSVWGRGAWVAGATFAWFGAFTTPLAVADEPVAAVESTDEALAIDGIDGIWPRGTDTTKGGVAGPGDIACCTSPSAPDDPMCLQMETAAACRAAGGRIMLSTRQCQRACYDLRRRVSGEDDQGLSNVSSTGISGWTLAGFSLLLLPFASLASRRGRK